MAPAVILIGCLLATISCVTTAQNISATTSPSPTTVHPPASFNTTTAAPPVISTINPSVNATAATPKVFNTTTAAPPVISTINPSVNATAATPKVSNTTTAAPPVISTINPPVNATAATPKVTSNPSNATTIPLTTRPGVTNATNTTTTQSPADGSCGNPDLCCSGKNDSCHRLNCFCDVACLRIGDCCPDFKPTCLTVNNSSNGTKPNNTLTLTGKCSQPTLCCSGVNYNCFRGCFCDEVCKQFNDCCPDLNSTCIFNTTTAPPPVNSTTNPSVNATAATPKDVLTLLTNLDVEILAEESSTEEEHQAALREVGALVESYLRQYNDIYSFEVTRIEPVSSSSSPCD